MRTGALCLLLLLLGACQGLTTPEMAASMASRVHTSVRVAAGCDQLGASCGSYRVAQGDVNAGPDGQDWSLSMSSGASQHSEREFRPAPVAVQPYPFYDPFYDPYWHHRSRRRGY